MTREQAVKIRRLASLVTPAARAPSRAALIAASAIIERRRGSYADYAHSCAVVYEGEMGRRHPGWSQCWQD
jgi:hypothetical protein